MFRTIHEFTAGTTRFFLKKSYQSSLRQAILFLFYLIIGFILFYSIELFLLFYLSGDLSSGIQLDIILRSLIISSILSLVVFVFFIFIAHYIISFFKKSARLKDTFIVFVYSIIPIFIIIPVVNLYSVINSSFLKASLNVFYTHILLIIWMFLMFVLLSVRIYAKGLSVVHRLPSSRIYLTIFITTLGAGLLLFFLPVNFRILLLWIAL